MIPLTEDKKLDLIDMFVAAVESETVCKNAKPYMEMINDVNGVAVMPSNFWACPCGECHPMSFLQVAVNSQAFETIQRYVEKIMTTLPLHSGAVFTTVFKPGEMEDAEPTVLCLKNYDSEFPDLEYSKVDRYHFNLVSRKLKDHITFWEGITDALIAMLGTD
jgi:hypothetical protein